MSEVRDPAITALLAEARLQFARSIPAKVADLQSLLDRGAWDELRRAAHKLRGSTGTYGFAGLSAAAADVEEALLEAGGNPTDEVRQRIGTRVREATLEAERAAR
jgi:HPt (histidine-containing phosphotransfer) domain-containing protein